MFMIMVPKFDKFHYLDKHIFICYVGLIKKKELQLMFVNIYFILIPINQKSIDYCFTSLNINFNQIKNILSKTYQRTEKKHCCLAGYAKVIPLLQSLVKISLKLIAVFEMWSSLYRASQHKHNF